MFLFSGNNQHKEIHISEFVQAYKAGKYSLVEIKDNVISGVPVMDTSSSPLSAFTKTSNNREIATLPVSDSLKDIGIDISAPLNSVKIVDTTSLHFWSDLAPTIIGTLFFLIIFVLLMGRMM